MCRRGLGWISFDVGRRGVSMLVWCTTWQGKANKQACFVPGLQGEETMCMRGRLQAAAHTWCCAPSCSWANVRYCSSSCEVGCKYLHLSP